MSKSIFLVLTSAIAIDGGICKKDALVEVSELEAKNLLHRGKARLATADDGAPANGDEDDGGLPDLSKLKKPQLLELVKALNLTIEGADNMKLDDLRAAIVAATEEAE